MSSLGFFVWRFFVVPGISDLLVVCVAARYEKEEENFGLSVVCGEERGKRACNSSVGPELFIWAVMAEEERPNKLGPENIIHLGRATSTIGLQNFTN